MASGLFLFQWWPFMDLGLLLYSVTLTYRKNQMAIAISNSLSDIDLNRRGMIWRSGLISNVASGDLNTNSVWLKAAQDNSFVRASVLISCSSTSDQFKVCFNKQANDLDIDNLSLNVLTNPLTLAEHQVAQVSELEGTDPTTFDEYILSQYVIRPRATLLEQTSGWIPLSANEGLRIQASRENSATSSAQVSINVELAELR